MSNLQVDPASACTNLGRLGVTVPGHTQVPRPSHCALGAPASILRVEAARHPPEGAELVGGLGDLPWRRLWYPRKKSGLRKNSGESPG